MPRVLASLDTSVVSELSDSHAGGGGGDDDDEDDDGGVGGNALRAAAGVLDTSASFQWAELDIAEFDQSIAGVPVDMPAQPGDAGFIPSNPSEHLLHKYLLLLQEHSWSIQVP